MASDNYRQPWLIEIPIQPKSRDDRDRLAGVLARLADEDPAFGFATDADTGQILLRGMGELHLDIKISILRSDIKIDILRRPRKIEFNVGAPQVAYREKITTAAQVDYVLKAQDDGPGQLARVKIFCEPRPADAGFKFENWVIGGALSRESLAAVERGVDGVVCAGVLAGYPVVDLKVTLIDGASGVFDSSALVFEVATREALREALRKGVPVLLEPVMNVEVATPEDCARLVVGDINARRGQIVGQDICGSACILSAKVPLANMFGYVKILRSISQGRATSVMQFDRYAPVPLSEGDAQVRPAFGMRPRAPLVAAANRESLV
jgi:elongation factor G